MSKDLPQPQQSEEVDLGQLFKLIGNAFDRLFRFIGSIFIGIYKVILTLLIHFYNRLIWYVGAVIIGFITGSLGVVWPWKKSVFLIDQNGIMALDSNGDKIIVNYERYFPDLNLTETWWSILFIILGITILLALDWYGKNRKRNA